MANRLGLLSVNSALATEEAVRTVLGAVLAGSGASPVRRIPLLPWLAPDIHLYLALPALGPPPDPAHALAQEAETAIATQLGKDYACT